MHARNILDLAWLIPAFPAFGAVVLLLFGRRIGEPKAGWFATAMVTLSFVASVIAFFALRSLSPDVRVNVTQGFTWIQSGTFRVDFRFLVDPLASTMTLFVTGIGALIHLYAIGYMHGDERFSRFFAYLNLFVASMLVLVLGSSFLMTFLGWEGVGLCSYLLISFWFERNSAAVAGKKAFITNRVGDFGFMLAMFLIFEKLGTLNYSVLGTSEHASAAVTHLSQTTVTAIALLLFLGAMGKSAQLPLHIWLPDAMEGPTPVSALIHAATMVTAGVFLLVRAHVFFELSNHAGTIVAWLGAITALYAATVALVQNDIKRVLAYSTISQLGYMFLAVGVGAYSAAIFHMITHAFFKALLFLGAGSVIHGMHDEQDMRRMGGLRKYMPITAMTFVFGWLAIAGIVPFAGFWSKDEILAKAWFGHDYGLWLVGAAAALLTAFYMTRQVWLVFYSPQRFGVDAAFLAGEDHVEAETAATAQAAATDAGEPAGAAHGADAGEPPHESPWTMYVPLIALAFCSLVGGIIDLPFTNASFNALDRWLRVPEGPVAPHFSTALLLSIVALAIGVLGIWVGIRVYKHGLRADGTDETVDRLGGFAPVLENAWYINAAVSRFVSGPATVFAKFLSNDVDKGAIDGTVNEIGSVVRAGGGGLRRLQTGLVRNYALGIAFGTVLLLLYVSTRVAF
jgi:NADH-quinone oxidoreductase subunit L